MLKMMKGMLHFNSESNLGELEHRRVKRFYARTNINI
jgi:hypothetical protein